VTPFLENDAVLGNIDDHFKGDYLNEETILAFARAHGFSTAAVGKFGPGSDLRSHRANRRPDDHLRRRERAETTRTATRWAFCCRTRSRRRCKPPVLPLVAPSRGANGASGSFDKPGTTVANVEQQAYFADVVSKVLLPMFKANNRPFIIVMWSRDPDGSQHFQGDSLNALTPGINGPTSLAAIRNADDNLRQIQQAVNDLGLADTTDIIVAADHGFSDDFEGEQDEPRGPEELPQRAARFPSGRVCRGGPRQVAGPSAVRPQ